MRILQIIILTMIAISATYANARKIENGDQPVFTTQISEIPSTDIDPADTLIPARLPPGIKPLLSDNAILKPFLGVWRGQWEGTLDTYFVITEAQGARVKVFNSWGSNSIIKTPGMRYVWGKIYDGVLLLPSEKSSVSLKLQNNGTLFGLYYSQAVHMPSRIILTKEISTISP